jgi:hypothetical protein
MKRGLPQNYSDKQIRPAPAGYGMVYPNLGATNPAGADLARTFPEMTRAIFKRKLSFESNTVSKKNYIRS